MDIKEILNSSMELSKKIQLLTSADKSQIGKYINYYNGKQDILNRLHPQNPTKEVSKLVFNYYKKITNTASYFLFGKEPELILLNPSDENNKLFEIFKESYEKAKTDDLNQKIGIETLGFSETAEIAYESKGDVKHTLLSSKTNEIYPQFGATGDLTGITRVYKLKELIDDREKEIEYYEVYTETQMFKYKRYNSEYSSVNVNEEGQDIPFLEYRKIPIVFYKIDIPLAWEVKSLLDRYNLIHSTHADVNDKLAYPVLKLIGKPVTATSSDQEKSENNFGWFKNVLTVLHLANFDINGKEVKSDAEYLTWNTKPESAEMEMKNIKRDFMAITSTPDLSFDNLQGLGNVSGVALKLLFIDAISLSDYLSNVFFKLQRRINLHKELLAKIKVNPKIAELNIKAKFVSPIPENTKELIDNLVNSTMGGILSVETAIANNPYVENAIVEKENIDNNTVKGESFDL